MERKNLYTGENIVKGFTGGYLSSEKTMVRENKIEEKKTLKSKP